MKTESEQAIETLDALQAELNRIRHGLACECDDITEQWQCLAQAGGQRADHAATLLSRLRPHLAELSSTAAAMVDTITGLVADPFDRNKAA